MELHILLLLDLATPGLLQAVTVKGFRYKDNKSKYRWEEGNGMAMLSFNNFLPPSMTICLRGRILYNRHGDQNFWFNVIIRKKKERIGTFPKDFAFYQRSKGDWRTYTSSVEPSINRLMNKEEQDKAKASKGWPSRNSIRKWAHVCVVGDFTNDKTVLFLNGQKINETEFTFSKSFPDDYYSEELRSSGDILSGFSVEFGRYMYDSAPIIGDLMDINAWDRVLEEKEMEAITNCKRFEPSIGNMINMSSSFNLTGGPLVEAIELDSAELSCADTNKDILLPVRANTLEAAAKQCNRLLQNSFGPFFRTAEKYAALYKRVKSLPKTEGFKDRCWFGGRVLIWLPYKKTAGTTTWNHFTDGSELVFDRTIYVGIQPSAEVEEKDKCMRWYSGPLATKLTHGYVQECDEESVFEWSPCVSCAVPHTFERSLTVTMSGMCDRTAFDTFYHMDNDEMGLVTYYGFDSSMIRYDSNQRLWVLTIEHKPDIVATCDSELTSFVLGNHDWKVTNDFGCYSGGTEVKRVSFSTCSLEQYTCNDGLCVDLVSRCDGQVDCEDKSDEFECRLVEESKTYKKHLPPPPQHNKSKVEVEMSIEVINMGGIDEIESKVEFQFILHMTWFEGRMNFLNLRESGRSNLETQEMESLWVPKIVFYNTKERLKTLVDEEASMYVKRMGNFTVAKNKLVFKGSENSLSVSRFYKTNFICDFDMAWYPFDTQKCSMDFVVDKGSQNLLDLLVHNLNYSGPLELTQYFIKKKVFLDRTDDKGMEILYVDIYLGRRLLSIILTVFAPTVILNIVGHSSNYFKEFFFEAVISVNVTAMLVLTTMFINVSNNLPKTAYIKMIDIWLLFNLIKPFNDILVTTYMDYLKVDDEREINHHGVPRTVGNDENGDSTEHTDGVLQVVPASRSPSALKYVMPFQCLISRPYYSFNIRLLDIINCDIIGCFFSGGTNWSMLMRESKRRRCKCFMKETP